MIKSYCSGIKVVLRTEGIEIDDNIYELKLLTCACKLTNDTVANRLPIRKGLLWVILDKLESVYEKQPKLIKLYKAIFSLAYFGLLRISELP